MLGVVLAGGLSRRMEGPEKSLMPLAGRPLIAHACDRLERQIGDIIINANGDPARFGFLGKPVQGDTVEGFAGPLAGILAAMEWAEKNCPAIKRIVTVPADTPFFPDDLVARFNRVLVTVDTGDQDRAICLAYSDGNRHPVFGSWPVTLAADLKKFLVNENERKVMLFVQRYTLIKVDFPMRFHNGAPFDPFFNINTPADLALAGALFETRP